MISQRDALLLETVNTLKAQFDSMTEEVGSTRYLRNLVQSADRRYLIDRLGKASRYSPIAASDDRHWTLSFIAICDRGRPNCQAINASEEQYRGAGQAR